MDVVDLSMLSEEENAEETELIMMRKPHPRVSAASMVEEFVVPVMKMGLSCSAASPTERMIMTFVVNKLNDIKDRSWYFLKHEAYLFVLSGDFTFVDEFMFGICNDTYFANESDRLALLDFKNRVTQDPLHVMASWNNFVHFCSWVGITCSPSNGRVVILNLEGQKLVGSIPPSIGNLTFLTGINLVNNTFRGEIPQEIGRLLRLQHLNLTYNSFGGKTPSNLTHCVELATIRLGYNGLIGRIPDQLASLSKLKILELGANNLTGTIRTWIGNLSSLYALSLGLNNLQGTIPDELGRLSSLGFFQLYGNYLSGIVPPSIYNISSIYYFSVTQNQLQGHLPLDVGITLPNLEIFAGGVNNFTGTIPVSLSNASRLRIIDFAENGLTGTKPGNLENLEDLIRLNFEDNKLETGKIGDLSFFDFLTNISALEVLGLSGNRFGGELPNSIANLSDKLKIFTIGRNLIHGSIPVGIGNLVNLYLLGIEGNQLGGTCLMLLGSFKT
ncbi:hypothetical protein QUC31_011449 [Theobroma cacao]